MHDSVCIERPLDVGIPRHVCVVAPLSSSSCSAAGGPRCRRAPSSDCPAADRCTSSRYTVAPGGFCRCCLPAVGPASLLRTLAPRSVISSAGSALAPGAAPVRSGRSIRLPAVHGRSDSCAVVRAGGLARLASASRAAFDTCWCWSGQRSHNLTIPSSRSSPSRNAYHLSRWFLSEVAPGSHEARAGVLPL